MNQTLMLNRFFKFRCVKMKFIFMLSAYLILALKSQIILAENAHYVVDSNAKNIVLTTAHNQNINPSQKNKINDFFTSHNRKNQLSIVIKSNKALSNEQKTDWINLLNDSGLHSKQIQFSNNSNYNANEITIALESYSVAVKGCSNSSLNNTYHGCTTKNNLAAMISEPRQLIQPDRLSNSDAKATTNAIKEYQQPREVNRTIISLPSVFENSGSN